MIELEQARELLNQAVGTQGPDFAYKRPDVFAACYYRPMNGDEYDFEHDDPRNITGCLIGVALSLAGETRHLEVMGNVYRLNEMYPDMMSEETLVYFRKAQRGQDSGQTWGICFELAERLAEELISLRRK